MDPIDIYISEGIELSSRDQQDKKLAASGQLPMEPVNSKELLRVAGVCALGAICLKRKSLPLHVSKELISQGVLIEGFIEGCLSQKIRGKGTDVTDRPAGLLALATVGAFGFKRRSSPTGLYLMQLRVLSQGALVTGLAAGAGLNLLRNYRPRLAVQPKVVWW